VSDEAISLRLAPGEERELSFDMVPAARISGRVVGPDGAPVANARIDPWPNDAREAGRILGAFEGPGTDAAGRFSLDGIPADLGFHLTVLSREFAQWGGDFAPGTDLTIPLAGRSRMVEGRIPLPPGASVREVRISERETFTRLRPDGSFLLFAENDPAAGIALSAWFGDAIHRGRIQSGAGGVAEVDLSPAPAERAWLIRVFGPDGRPVPAGQCDWPGAGTFEEGRILFDAETEGWFKRGRHGVGDGKSFGVCIHSCRDERGHPLPYAPKVAGPFPAGVWSVTLEPGRVVTGEVVTGEGRPVPGAWVSAEEVCGPEVGEAWTEVHARAQSDAAGRFALAGLGPGAYKLQVNAPPGHVRPAPVPLGPEEGTVRIVAEEMIAARVTVGAGGRPVPGARVVLNAPDEGAPFTDGRIVRTTGGEGVAVFPLLPPGFPAVLVVTPPDDGLLPAEVHDFRLSDARIELARAFTLSGTVLDAAGRPVPDAAVFVRALPGAPPLPVGFSFERIEGGFVLGALTGPDGAFEIRRLVSTTLELFAARVAEDGTESRTPVTTAPAGAAGLVLRLP
jgi:protocatechuate 3,4-dioxygenase beta subunit